MVYIDKLHLGWVAGVRTVTIEQKVEVSELRVPISYFEKLLEKHVRELYALPDDYRVKVNVLDTGRTDDVAEIEIVRVKGDG